MVFAAVEKTGNGAFLGIRSFRNVILSKTSYSVLDRVKLFATFALMLSLTGARADFTSKCSLCITYVSRIIGSFFFLGINASKYPRIITWRRIRLICNEKSYLVSLIYVLRNFKNIPSAPAPVVI